ncbi:MAG: PEP-CTERM sorting domain-containing protein [Fimbriimonadaceae bacterium]
MKRLIALVTAGLMATSSFAILFETESNNDFASANLIARGTSPWSDIGIMRLGGTGGDIDFFKISLEVGETIMVMTTPMEVEFDTPDTMLGIFDFSGALVAFNDDAGGLGSAVRYTATSTEDHYIGVTGFPDGDFVGDHAQVGDYVLLVGVVPEPATMTALALGGAFLLRRRKK